MRNTPGEADYRRGARERLQEAGILLERGLLGGAVYLAGRAVECMLRCVMWKWDADIRGGSKALDTGHDLRAMLNRIGDLGALTNERLRTQISVDVQKIDRLWHNNMRYLPTVKIKAHWWRLGEIGRNRTSKSAVSAYYKACSETVRRCEAL